MRRSLFSWIYPPFLAFTVACVAAFTAFTMESATRFFFDLSSLELKQTSRLAANAIAGPKLAGPAADLEALRARCAALAADSGLRLTVVAPDGRVLADTERAPESMENHLDRAEIKAALESGSGSAVRRSASTGIATFYEAVALRGPDGKIEATVRTSMPFGLILARRRSLALTVLGFGLCLAAAASLLAILLAKRLAAPILRIHSGALSFSSGKLDERVPEEGPREVANLAAMMNRMAGELDERMRTIRDQKNQAEAILNGMSEAVAVVDSSLSLVSSNPAFLRLFGGRPGESLMAVTRNAELCDFMEAAVNARGPLEGGITVYGDATRQLRLTSSPIDGGRAVLVLNDLTRLNKLETIRKDFTANVSHELKTPLAAVKAALETLDSEGFSDPQLSRKFLDMAVRGTTRLEAILADLLSLARIEENERKGIDMRRVDLDALVDSCLADLSGRFARQGMEVLRQGERGLGVSGQEGLIRQALSNLLDNGIKYAASGGKLVVSTQAEGNFAVISVKDFGQGIPEKDRPRLFERFYRVDKARSRDSGGTGLGLAIVKHIAKAHSGSVRVESAEGSGSTFSFLIPLFS
jgi:two-component system phosphate regulon sensor histidine kinase PhoR